MRSRSLVKRCLIVLLWVAVVPFFLSAPGCKKPEPARIIFAIEGELFSEASFVIDGKPVGKFTQTLTKKDGRIYIDGAYKATLPPDHKDIPEEDSYTGALDSVDIQSGEHIITLMADDGKFLHIKATVPPGRILLTYFSDEGVLKWDGQKTNAAPGETVTITLKK